MRRATVLCVAMLSIAPNSKSSTRPKEEWVKGAVVVAVKSDGGCVFKPFVKVEDTDGEEEPQILGYSPGNVHVNSSGEIVWERVSEAHFIPLRGFKSVRGRICKAPPYNE